MKGLQQLSPGVFFGTFEGGNCGAVIENGRALLIDTPMLPHEALEWRRQLRQFGAERIYAIVNTDFHPEHYLGNAAFMPADVWGHETTFRQVSRYRNSLVDQITSLVHEVDPRVAESLAGVELITPTVTVEDRVTLYWSEHEIQIYHLDGHTTASLGVYLPAESILFAGDTVVSGEPPAMGQADSRGWLEALNMLKALRPQTLVPGIGLPCSLECLEHMTSYLQELRTRVAALYEAGASRRECVEKVNLESFFETGPEQSSRTRRRLREAVERVYAEIRTEMRRRQE